MLDDIGNSERRVRNSWAGFVLLLDTLVFFRRYLSISHHGRIENYLTRMFLVITYKMR